MNNRQSISSALAAIFCLSLPLYSATAATQQTTTSAAAATSAPGTKAQSARPSESNLAKQQSEASAKYGAESEQAAAIWLQLGKYYSVNKRYDQADAALKRAALAYRAHKGANSKEYATALYWVGANFNSGHKYDKANTAFIEVARIRTALKDWSGVADVYCEQAVALSSTGRHDEAVSVLLKSLDLRGQGNDPASPLWEVSYSLLSRELLESPQKEMAETQFQQGLNSSIENLGKNASSTILGLKTFAELCTKLRDYNSAANAYKQLVEANDFSHVLSDADLEAVLGEYLTILVHLNRYEESAQVEGRLQAVQSGKDLERWQSAVKAQPMVPSNHVGLAQILRNLGRYDEAESECNAALGINPDSQDATKLLEEIHSHKSLHPTQPPSTEPKAPAGTESTEAQTK